MAGPGRHHGRRAAGGAAPRLPGAALAEALGVSLTIEDTWGGDLVTAAISHLAASVRPELLFTVSFMNDWVQEHIAGWQPRSQKGYGAPAPRAGLGVEVDAGALGEPLFVAG